MWGILGDFIHSAWLPFPMLKNVGVMISTLPLIPNSCRFLRVDPVVSQSFACVLFSDAISKQKPSLPPLKEDSFISLGDVSCLSPIAGLFHQVNVDRTHYPGIAARARVCPVSTPTGC